MENTPKMATPAAAPVVTLPLSVIEARKNVVAAESKSYGARIHYASELNNMAAAAWYRDGAEKIISIETEKSNLYADLKAIQHSNPSKVWGDIKKYALEDAQNRGLFGEVKPVTEASEAAPTGNAHVNTPKSPLVRYSDELSILYKFGEREKAFFDDKLKAVHLKVCEALDILKIDKSKLK